MLEASSRGQSFERMFQLRSDFGGALGYAQADVDDTKPAAYQRPG